MSLNIFLYKVKQWANERPDVLGLALVGSHARGAPGLDSDVDLIILCKAPEVVARHYDWTAVFGEVLELRAEDYNAVRSLRVFYKQGLEIEFGITAPTWASLPLDPGTRKVVSDGIKILHDQEGLFEKAVAAIAIGAKTLEGSSTKGHCPSPK